MSETALATNNLGKSFDGMKALSGVDMSFARGRMHAVVGENGAAKTTMFKLAAGMLSPTTGSVSCLGKALRPGDARAASDAGIGLLTQHGSLASDLTVLENFALAGKGAGRIDWQVLAEEARTALDRLDVSCGVHDRICDLPLGTAKVVELARLLWSGKNILLLDEPTAILGPRRAGKVFAILRDLAMAGVTVMFSSHRIDEVTEWAEEVHVLRKGRHVLSSSCANVTGERILGAMFGDRGYRQEEYHAVEIEGGAPVLELRSLLCQGLAGSRPIDLQVKKGRCVAVVGPPGNGQDEVMAALAGLAQPLAGEIMVGGRRSDGLALHGLGMGRMPADAAGQAAMASMYVDENMMLHDCFKPQSLRTPLGLVNWPAIKARAQAVIEKENLAIPDPDCRFDWLSGGNQRKLLLARELSGEPVVFVAQDVEAGLDHVACLALARRLQEMKSAGTGLLLFAEEIGFFGQMADEVHRIESGELSGEAAHRKKS